jgi:hypothetical protein
MKLDFRGVDISTEEKFIRYIKALNQEIMGRNAETNDPKEPIYDINYLRKRYRRILAKEKRALFMAEHECLKCVYFQRMTAKCQANGKCLLEEPMTSKGGQKS